MLFNFKVDFGKLFAKFKVVKYKLIEMLLKSYTESYLEVKKYAFYNIVYMLFKNRSSCLKWYGWETRMEDKNSYDDWDGIYSLKHNFLKRSSSCALLPWYISVQPTVIIGLMMAVTKILSRVVNLGSVTILSLFNNA